MFIESSTLQLTLSNDHFTQNTISLPATFNGTYISVKNT